MKKLENDHKLKELKEYIDERKDRKRADSYLIEILHKAQMLYGYLSREVMDFVAENMQIPTSHVWGVATFYHFFNLEPIGKYTISVCMGTACYVKGANLVLGAIKEKLGIEVGETTDDKVFTLNEARCLGACGLAPVIMIGEKIHGDLDREKTIQLLEEYREKAEKEEKLKA